MTDATLPRPATRAPKAGGIFGLIPLLKSRRLVLALTILSGILAQAGTLASLAVGAWLVGHAVTGATPASLVPGFIILGIVAVFAAAARWWQAYISHDLAFALIETLQVGIYDGLERAAPGYVLGQRTGELASVATTDAELMEHFYAHTIADYVGAVVVPLGALIVIFMLSPLAALALLPFLPLVASVPFWLARRAGEQGRQVMHELGALNAETVEVIQGQRELAIFGRMPDRLARLIQQTRHLAAAQKRYGSRAGLEHSAIDGLVALAVLTSAIVGIWLVSRGSLDRAHFPLLIVLAGAAFSPIVEVTQTARKLGELRAGAARILTIFHQQPAVHDTGRDGPSPDTTVHFNNVRFGYGHDERGSVLNGVSFSVRPGETVALVGRSGAGKSTCSNLLLRFWDVDDGRIAIGDCDIRDRPISALRKLVAYVPQDVHLFNESIADNIRLGLPNAPIAAVERAARLAQAHDFVAELPQGYDTVCGERGARLSGGQRQRIAIARALLLDAPILLLDEASSSLDSENEKALQTAMNEIRRDRTVIVIAHRLSTIRSADRILVLDGGRIVEEGRHADLVEKGGVYARLITSAEAFQ
ncbi:MULTISPECIES: thiol reductant ABC exporter subunit CydC [unclassified Beijerinckia]|uniref:thiol reductant ABC exporter subunit CydC n=1 Tax=unclassified Beijerinckia TaxID=2638183 RepID=UPI00089C5E61|nr:MULTISPECIES: thiol reductant ABC exporter subunit CydC [unclassified Beijerinckia]MDH7794930.1 ATP-binding cassette subfamily C protein CydC [Beijerinckia sp. GAS462]SEB80820.1 ATP-binding cassette, subfamily C, CydCD [Beijerinckia sp. 28-YEA-48]